MTDNTTLRSQSEKLVLIADDLPEVISMWAMELRQNNLRCLAVTSLEDLWIAYDLYKDEISGIILDGCIPGDTPNTLPFIRMARDDGFRGQIVAASSSDLYRHWMMQDGCSDQSPKGGTVNCLLGLFRILENLERGLNGE